MGKNSKIEWTHHTFNPWRGCTRVSEGCRNCYAETMSHRNPKVLGEWGPNGRRVIAKEAYWRQPIAWNREAERAGERRRVFCASLADVFEANPQVTDARARLFELIERTPWLDWLLLTKRPENIEGMMPLQWFPPVGLPRNIWFGCTTENQDEFDARWPVMEAFARNWHPAIVFLSIEPLLGPMDIAHELQETDIGDDYPVWTRPPDWIIVGGESGANARPMHVDWVRSLRDQCIGVGVAFHFKQWGEWMPLCDYYDGDDLRRSDSLDQPHVLLTRSGILWNLNVGQPWVGTWAMSRVGKQLAGRELDGQVWDEFPEVRHGG